MNLHENREVFEEVLAAASLPVEQGGIGVRLAFLEKDYWVTRALRNLAESREDQSRFAEPAGWQSRTLAESPLVMDFDSVWESLRPVYERELSDLAYRPLPESEEVVASFKTIVRLLLK